MEHTHAHNRRSITAGGAAGEGYCSAGRNVRVRILVMWRPYLRQSIMEEMCAHPDTSRPVPIYGDSIRRTVSVRFESVNSHTRIHPNTHTHALYPFQFHSHQDYAHFNYAIQTNNYTCTGPRIRTYEPEPGTTKLVCVCVFVCVIVSVCVSCKYLIIFIFHCLLAE